jgi:hypothetical protein
VIAAMYWTSSVTSNANAPSGAIAARVKQRFMFF